MGCSMANSEPMPDLCESGRRRATARGRPVRLADGCEWLLASPTFRACPDHLTQPSVDRVLDQIIDKLALGEDLSLEEIWEAARILLRANYDLQDNEVVALLSVAPGLEAQALADAVLDALFGSDEITRTYTDWVRASLLANGLAASELSARDLPNVLAILVSTHRTIPLTQFTDACRAASERKALESLI
jgi:hypothetical protein